MIYKLIVPGPIENVDEVRVLEWHGTEGRVFESGELIVELETYKAVVEVRAGQRGILRQIICDAGSWKEIGEALAVLSDDVGEPLPNTPDEIASWPVEFELI